MRAARPRIDDDQLLHGIARWRARRDALTVLEALGNDDAPPARTVRDEPAWHEPCWHEPAWHEPCWDDLTVTRAPDLSLFGEDPTVVRPVNRALLG